MKMKEFGPPGGGRASLAPPLGSANGTWRRHFLPKGNVFTSVCQEFCPWGRGVCQTLPPGQTRQTPPPRHADTPQADTPLGRHPQADTPLRVDTPLDRQPLPPSRRPLQQTVRILLEYILV